MSIKVTVDGVRKKQREDHDTHQDAEETEVSTEEYDVVRASFQFPEHIINNSS